MFVFEAVLTFLLIKHYLFDFVFQTDRMIQDKSVYGRPWGLAHSLLHGLGTFIVLMIYGIKLALILAVIESLLHYHIDWIKVRWGCRDMEKPAYWNHFGLDQLAHGLTYVFIAGVIVRSL